MSDKTITHNCIIAVDERGTAVLLKSEPSLYDSRWFDGMFLEDNLTDPEEVPKEFGVYRCKIMCEGFRSWTDFGYEYDTNIWIDEVAKIDIEKPEQ